MNFYEKCEFSQELTEFTKMQSEKFTNFAEFIKPKGQKFTQFLQTAEVSLKAKNSRDFAILQSAKKFKHFTKTQTKGLRFDTI